MFESVNGKFYKVDDPDWKTRGEENPLDEACLDLNGWPPASKEQKARWQQEYEFCLKQGKEYQRTGNLDAFRKGQVYLSVQNVEWHIIPLTDV